MATVIVLVGCYYGYNGERRPGRRGDGDGEVDGAEHRARAPHRDARHAALLGREPTSADRRMTHGRRTRPPGRAVRRRAPARTPLGEEDLAPRRAGAPLGPGAAARRPSACRSSTSAAAPDDDEYRWHTGLNRPTGVARRRRVRRRPQGVRPQQDPARPEHGHPRRQDLDDPRARRAPGKSVCIKHMVGLLYPDEGDVLVHGESVPEHAPTTSCSRCARSSASCSRTARSSAR